MNSDNAHSKAAYVNIFLLPSRKLRKVLFQILSHVSQLLTAFDTKRVLGLLSQILSCHDQLFLIGL